MVFPFRRRVSATLLAVLCLSAGAWAQSAGAAVPAAAASPAASPSPAAAAGNTEAGALPAASPAPSAGNPLVGSWKVERGVFELFGNLKDIAGQDERFYSLLRLDAGGKGVVRYGAKSEETEIEWEVRNGQSLTVAYGSRLKPQVDLFNLVVLGDGSLYLRSTRMAQVNGTVTYIFKRGN
jgi:hypothetical protein